MLANEFALLLKLFGNLNLWPFKVLHQGQNFWISNRLPLGVHQCACVQVREAGVGDKVVYPIQYNWVGNLNYIGRCGNKCSINFFAFK